MSTTLFIGGPNQFLKDPVEKVLQSAIKNTSPNRLINSISNISKAAKSRTIKEYSAKSFHDTVVHLSPLKCLKEYRDKVLNMVSLYLTSSDENTRWWGKKLLIVLASTSDFEQYVKSSSLDSQTANNLLNQAEQLKSNPLGGRRVHSGVRSKHSNSASRNRYSNHQNHQDSMLYDSDAAHTQMNTSSYSARTLYHGSATSSAGSSRTRVGNSHNNSAPGTGHGARALHQITADNESIKELTEAMKAGSLVDRKRAINRFCDKCVSPKPEDKRFINDNMAKLADAYLDLIKTSNNKVNEVALKGLHKCLHNESAFLSSSAFRDHVPNYIQAVVSHLNSNSRMSSMAKLAESALDRMIVVLDVAIIFPPLANRLNYERPLNVKKVLADKIVSIIQGEKGRGILKNTIIERHALPALYSMASLPQVRTESQILAEVICDVIGEERLWNLADVHNRSNILAQLISRSSH